MMHKRILFTLTALGVFLFAASRPAGAYDVAKKRREQRARRAERAARVGDYPPTPWEKAIRHESKYYLVTTNTDKRTADYIGQLMDFSQREFRKAFNYKDEIPRLPIYAYRTFEDFVTHGNAPPGSSGFFRYHGADLSIHVAYIDRWGSTRPTEVLLHEGTHHFVHMALDFRIPEQFADRFPEGMRTLSTVPVWLNEGLATYMEVSYYDGKRLVVGEINEDRLRHLRRMIRDGENPSLRELFTIESSPDFHSPHYAVAWGVTWYFFNDAKSSVRRRKKKALVEFVEACQKGFMDNPEKELQAIFDSDDARKKGFFPVWKEHVHEKAFETFKDLTVGKKMSFEKWEEYWARWILELNTGDPYGGLYRRRR